MSYTAADITELDDVQHTRLRPAVNLGLDVLNTALRELVDNAIEEVADPSHGGSSVTITLHADGSVSVADDGRGLPIDSDPVNGKNGIVKTLGTALDKVIRTPDMEARLGARGVVVTAADGAQFRTKLQAELDKWRRVAREANVSLD